ncbi:MAG: hypothetical protein COB67_05305 [SAR324 cluster bacterium]|uniref:Twin-arginine translocation pathway signal protein n=1 Tax=SAR324 cluster bacterium TaxID=2024889 RepID=A0A2A4T5W0_9DELT|nr:MAG: hypothetical protein COB67_05305 [SAR324 cluster bacterium]
MAITRRQLIKTGIWGSTGLVTLRLLVGPFQSTIQLPQNSEYEFLFLREADKKVLAGIIPVMLEQALGDTEQEKENSLHWVLQGVDEAILGLTPSIQDELRELFMLLYFAPTRRLLARVWNPWLEATGEEIRNFLEQWRNSRFILLQTAYQALHELITAAWYANPASWDSIGYDGPPII